MDRIKPLDERSLLYQAWWCWSRALLFNVLLYAVVIIVALAVAAALPS